MPKDSEELSPLKTKESKEERVKPLSEDVRSRYLLLKFSREPIWEALNEATEQALPKWVYPPEPKLNIVNGYAVWQYSLPQHFTSVTQTVTTNKNGGKRYGHKTQKNSIDIHTGVKAKSLEELPTPAFDLDFFHGLTEEPNDAMKLMEARGRAFEQYHEDFFRVTILWESILAACAASWHIWNRWHEVGSVNDSEETRLKIVAPFFEAVGIDVMKVWKVAFGVQPEGQGKRRKKPYAPKLSSPYLLKKSEATHGKLSKREREKRNREYDAEMLRKTNALEALVNEQKEQDLKAFEAKYGKVSKSKLKKSPEYAASIQAKWDEFRVAKWNEPVAQTGIATGTKSPRSRKVKQKSNTILHSNAKSKRV